jgi:hypothetical protein
VGQKRNAHRVLVGKHEGMRPLGRRKLRSVDNIKVDLSEGRTWTGLIWLKIGISDGLLGIW